LDIKNTDIVFVKIGYLVPELFEIQKGWLMALTPGGVDQDLRRINYQRIERPMFPLDSFPVRPDLSSIFVAVNE
jgi:microcystin degradation protein MlrC